MARSCCGSNTCGCKVEGGTGVSIVGTGTPNDPFVISADMNLDVVDNTTFDLSLTGIGTPTEPYALEVDFAPTASVDDFPDVNTSGKTPGQVMGWNGTAWVAVAPTTAASGAVVHDTSMSGDGSAGSPLQIAEAVGRLLATASDGLGLSDIGMNSVVRHWSDPIARLAANPAPTLNALSTVETNPGGVDYWTGTEWLPIVSGVQISPNSTALLELSGSYIEGATASLLTKNATFTTDQSGAFTAVSADDLFYSAGVLSVNIQSVGAVAWQANVVPTATEVRAVAYSMGSGQLLSNQQLTATVNAILY